ncbi:MAG TPA: GNAT family protein [Gemmatimonadales bacterium]|nr:GNAT family protein [Gemmatimonadales bacterium]
MQITLPGCVVRDWRFEDAPSLARHANDARIARNLRDAFPHPYSLADADAFLTQVDRQRPRTFFAIAVDDEAVGGIGYTLHTDVERVGAEIGYWIGVAYWGRGLTTAALRAVTGYVFQQHPELRRVWAVPFAGNTASIHVLERVGYRLEGRMRESAIKYGQVTDQLLYAKLRSDGL